VRVAPLRIARRRHLAIDLGAHLHHSISDFGLICLRQIIRTNIEQFRHGGTILSFAATFAFILGLTLSGLGLPALVNPLPTPTSDQR